MSHSYITIGLNVISTWHACKSCKGHYQCPHTPSPVKRWKCCSGECPIVLRFTTHAESVHDAPTAALSTIAEALVNIRQCNRLHADERDACEKNGQGVSRRRLVTRLKNRENKNCQSVTRRFKPAMNSWQRHRALSRPRHGENVMLLRGDVAVGVGDRTRRLARCLRRRRRRRLPAFTLMRQKRRHEHYQQL